MDERHGLVADIGPPWGVTQVQVLLHHLPQTQVLSQGGGQEEAGIGHQVRVVELHPQSVQSVR